MADLRSIYENGMESVADIDVKHDSLTDQETAGKRKLTDDLINATQSGWEPFLANATSQMDDMDIEVLAGVYFAIQKNLK